MKTKSNCYNKKGEAIDFMEWAKLLEDKDYKIIKQQVLTNGKFVSTVYLGLNHNYGEGKPLIFETMVFPKKGDYQDLDTDRYSTLEEAKKGHQKLVEKWKNI